MESAETNQIQWTEREQELAQKFDVEPKLIRLLDKIAAYQIGKELAMPLQGKAEAQEVEPEAVEDAPTTKPREVEISQGEKLLRKWLLDLDYRSKLACVIMSTLQICDHGTDKLANEIIDKYSNEILAEAAGPLENLPSDELLMTGVVVEQDVWCAHY